MRSSMTHADLPLLMRSLRQGAELNQQQFADLLKDFVHEKPESVTRWFVNRIENRHNEVTSDLAKSLDEMAESLRKDPEFGKLLIKNEVPEFSFSSLAAEQRAHAIEGDRGLSLSILVSEPGLQQLYVVLCDLRYVADSIAVGIHAAKAPSVRVTLVIPTEERLKQLFDVVPVPEKKDERKAISDEESLYHGYSERLSEHIKAEVRRLQRLADYEKIGLSVYVSPGVLNPAVIAIRGPDKSACLYWPCRPERKGVTAEEFALVEGGTDIANWYRRFVDRMIQENFSTRHHYGDVILMPGEPGEPSAVASEQGGQEVDTSVERPPTLQPIDTVEFSNVLARATPDTHMRKMSKYEAMAISMVWVKCQRIRHGKFVTYYLFEQTQKVAEAIDTDESHPNEDESDTNETVVMLSLINAHISVSYVYESLVDQLRYSESLKQLREDIIMSQGSHLSMDVSIQTAELTGWINHLRDEGYRKMIDTVLEGAFWLAARDELSMTYGIEVGDKLKAEERQDGPWEVLTREGGTRLLTRAFVIELTAEEVDRIHAGAEHKEGAKLVEVEESDLRKGSIGNREFNSYIKARRFLWMMR